MAYRTIIRPLIAIALLTQMSHIIAQDIFPSIHLGIAEGNSSLHRMVGASFSIKTTHQSELRLRVDTSIGNATNHSKSHIDSKLGSLSGDWIFHRKGVHNSGFIIGTGVSTNSFQWTSVDYLGVGTSQSYSFPSIHLILGGGIGSNFRLESKLDIGLPNYTNGNYQETTSTFLLSLNATWAF